MRQQKSTTLRHPLVRSSLLIPAVLLLPALGATEMAASPGTPQEPPTAEIQEGRPGAVPFELTTIEDQSWSLSDHEGKVVILEWIDPECPAVARQHSPQGTIQLSSTQFSNPRRFQWLAINSSSAKRPQAGQDVTAAAAKRLGIEYPVALDPTGWVGRAYGVMSATHVVVVDPRGKVMYSGAPDTRTVGGRLASAIREAAGLPANGVTDRRSDTPLPRALPIRYADEPAVGSALPPFELRLGEGLRLTRRELLGTPFALEWTNLQSDEWRQKHGPSGSLAKAPSLWEDAGARWLLVHGLDPVSDRGKALTAEEAVTKQLIQLCPVADPVFDSGKMLRKKLQAAPGDVLIADHRGVLIYRGPADARGDDGRLRITEVREKLDSQRGNGARPPR